jgi:hypothetical protein
MKKILSLLLLTSYLMSCGPSQKVTSSWVSQDGPQGAKYKTVFILALVQNQSAKNIIETDLAKAAEARGMKVYKSSEVFAVNFTKENLPDKQTILEKVRSLGCEGVLSIGLVDKQSETRFVPGTTMYSPYMGYGGGFGGYYGYMGPMMYNPGYYTEEKTYFMEADLFDVASEKLIWSAQSEAYDPSSISKFSRDYTAVIVDRINKDFNKK